MSGVADKTDDEDETDESELEAFIDKMKDMKKGVNGQVHDNIQKAQKQQKEYYDRKHTKSVVSFVLLIDCDICIATLYRSSNLSPQLLSFVALLLQKLKPGSLVLRWNSARDGRKGDEFQAWYLGPYEIDEHLGEKCFQTAQPHNRPSAQEQCECMSSEAIS